MASMEVPRPSIKLVLGRERVTNVVSPAEASYIHSIKRQGDLVRKNLERVIEHVGFVVADAILFGLQPAFDRSQEIVPELTGKLKRSGFMEARTVASGAQAVIGYGRYGRPTYTAFVHERMDVRHAAGKKAKFLEGPVLSNLDLFSRRVVLYMRKATGATP